MFKLIFIYVRKILIIAKFYLLKNDSDFIINSDRCKFQGFVGGGRRRGRKLVLILISFKKMRNGIIQVPPRCTFKLYM